MIRWFASNGVAANLLGIVTIVAGLLMALSNKLELMPDLDLDAVQIQVAYPGAAPQEVESGIIRLIEDRIQEVEGIKKMTATAMEGFGSVLVEVRRGHSVDKLQDRIQMRVEGIDNFPEEAKTPRIEAFASNKEVITLAIYGDAGLANLKQIAGYIRDELSTRRNITQSKIKGVAPYEISINLSESALRRYGLSFDHVVGAIRQSSVDIPGGTIKAPGGQILLRTVGKAYDRSSFREIPVLTQPDGGVVQLGQLAEVVDGFDDNPQVTKFNGQRAVLLQVFAAENQSVLHVADQVREFVQNIRSELPAGIQVKAFRNMTLLLEGRLMMLVENALYGLILVFLVLALFLRPLLAFFVMLGIVISFLGTMLFLGPMGVSINLTSLFGFILVLGILVDDALIVGESIFSEFQARGGPGVEASVRGTHKVMVPVTFSVLTTIIAFLPIFAVPGFYGKYAYAIPVVVIAALICSLIQSKLMLPYHLTLCRVGEADRERLGWLRRNQRKVADYLEHFIERRYRPALDFAMRFRYATVAIFIALLMVTGGLLVGKHFAFVFFPVIPDDNMVAKLVMPEGTPIELTLRATGQIEAALDQLMAEVGEELDAEPFDSVVVSLGAQPFGDVSGATNATGTHRAEIAVELAKRVDLPAGITPEAFSAPALANRWRELIGPVPGAKELSFSGNSVRSVGAPIDIQLAGRDFVELSAAAEAIKAQLATYEGLHDIKDSYGRGMREIQIGIQPGGVALGLRQADVGRQVRAAFHGIEAQRIQRGRDDVKVMVRYPPGERGSIENLEDLRLRTPDGREVPFGAVADFTITDGFSVITRVDRRRVVNVTAEANKAVAKLGLIKDDLRGRSPSDSRMGAFFERIATGFKAEPPASRLDAILADYPNLTWTFEGETRAVAEIFSTLLRTGTMAVLVIYAMLAIPLKSYLQPIIVMIVIPFGLIGAIGGHIIMGHTISILSIIGMVALIGVVVNDSLLLVDRINQGRRAGVPLHQAIMDAGARRFRPIVLTSLTTFAGLLPLLFETSLDAQALIPMSISLGYGVLFATFVSLILVPAFYYILEDIRAAGGRWLHSP